MVISIYQAIYLSKSLKLYLISLSIYLISLYVGISNLTHTPSKHNDIDIDRVEAIYIPINSAVIYYCSCLVSSTPGKVYLTNSHICISYTVINTTKEIYPLDSIQSEIITERSKGMYNDSIYLTNILIGFN
jgi:hypothetical protein